MNPRMKSCFVSLDRNLPNFNEIPSKVNNSLMIETKNCDEKRISDCEILPLVAKREKNYKLGEKERKNYSDNIKETEVRKKKGYKLREEDKINYSDDIEAAEGEDLHSERSYDSNYSSDQETDQKKKRNHKKYKLGEKERKNYSDNVKETEVRKRKDYKLREQDKINYSDYIEAAEGEDLHSERSYDSNSSSDQETDQEKKITSRNKLRCLFCEKCFNTHMSYLRHKRFHKCNSYKCILCTKMKFQNRQSFICHMKRYHPEGEPFLCDYPRCEQSFKTQKLLDYHLKTHYRFICKCCKKSFARKHDMRKHVLENH